MTKNKKNNQTLRNIYLTIGAIFCVYFLLLTIQAIFFEERFGLNTYIAGVDVSLKDKKEAEQTLQTAWLNYKNQKITLGNENYPTTDLITRVDLGKSVEDALSRQQSKYLLFGAYVGSKNKAKIVTNDTGLSQILSRRYNEVATKPVNAKIDLEKNKNIVLDMSGKRVLMVESRENIISDLGNFNKSTSYAEITLPAAFSASDAEALVSQAEAITSRPINLTSIRGDFAVSSAQLRDWLEITPVNPKTLILVDTIAPQSDSYHFFSTKKINAWLNELSVKINQVPVNAKLSFQNGTIAVTALSTTGYKLDQTDLLSRIENIGSDNRSLELKVTVLKPDVTEDNLTSLGLTELVSTGWSNFAGSPKNRIHNVITGASKFNGVLIKPGENFSFNTTLGPVEAYTGYLPELVILQDKTVPQYGGGLCQVSSTAFRAALNAGFPILERTMHAYPVSYYKPYGVDATIYLPKPDLVFTNDSGHYVLIQTRIEGTKLIFDFFGTKPDHSAKFSGNMNGAGAASVVEGVNPSIYDAGARGRGSFTATFYRLIYNNTNKAIRTDTFTSKYDSPDKFPH